MTTDKPNKQCNKCNNEDENETLFWDNELDYPNMVDYTCLCQTCYNKLSMTTDKPNFITVGIDEIRKDPTHRLDPKYWVRKNRHNAENLILAKMIAKHLIMHRIWNGLSQKKIAVEDLQVTHQQYQKIEAVSNDVFYVQVARIFKNRGWNKEVLEADPYAVLDEWLKRDYGNLDSKVLPDKYHKIINAWKLLDLKAEKNYYKNDK